ncbi:MAG: PAS domain S-box protein [Jaaginema sp. PMC 1079.18]|nr:PAS domain S-box protein [Jaaginema sp. PMC 1080.18]MEC4852942.1 PAS domain S-box protein [Jaaginema sp. PMC 1079.18]MEC4868445.1 PAS domain S-box protein [Jaaginema sp. PMC 1078.18]
MIGRLALATIRDRPQRIAALFDCVASPVLVFEPTGRILYFNRCCEQYLGYGASGAVNRTIESITASMLKMPLSTILPRLAQNIEVTWRWQGHNCLGQELCIVWNVQPCLDETGQLGCAIATGKPQALENWQKLDSYIAGISTRLLDLDTDTLDYNIHQILQEIGQITRAEQSYIFQTQAEGFSFSMTHEWSSQEEFSNQALAQNLPGELFPWSYQRLQEYQSVMVVRMADLTAKAATDRENWQRFRVKSLYIVPMHCQQKFQGWLGFATFNHERTWPDGLGQRLRLVAEILTNAFERQRQQISLRKIKERYELAILASGEGLWDWDLETNEVYWSPRYCEILGYTGAVPQVDLYKEWQASLHPDDRDRVFAAIEAHVQQKQQFYDIKYRLRNRAGEYRWILARGQAIWDENDKPKRMAGSLQDITALVEAETQLQQVNQKLEERIIARTAELAENTKKLALFIQSVPLAIAMFDEKMHYIAASDRWYSDFKLRDRTIIDRSLYEIFPELSHHWQAVYQRCLRGNVEKCEKDIFVRVNHDYDWVRWAIHPWYKTTGKVGGLVMFVENINERVLVEQRNAKLNQSLAHSNEELRQFVYAASHDLREPLRTVKSYLDLLIEDYGSCLDSEANLFINNAQNGAVRMQQLINDLLKYSRLSSQPQAPEVIDLDAVVAQVLENLAVAIAETQAQIQVDGLPTVYGNECSLIQLFQNIIANGIKFCNKATPLIKISATLKDQTWQIAIRDNGIGIEPQYQQRIFEVFQRLHSRDRYPGTGIGLAICQKVVSQHGGQIWLESEVDRGSSFYFTLPAAPSIGKFPG